MVFMNKVVLSVAALAAISVPVQMQAAEEMTAEQKIAAKKAAINELRNELNAAMVYVEKNDPEVKEEYLKTLATINLALTTTKTLKSLILKSTASRLVFRLQKMKQIMHRLHTMHWQNSRMLTKL